MIRSFSVVLLSLLLLAAGPRAWRQSGELPAREAHQAAAADARYVYAITNQLVARYDRTSGDRLAQSTGEAFHLNSGFLGNGKLLCAHSNYPRQPEQSEIKSLDLATMQLTTLKSFGDFGGSLTWVVRHDEHWWCNFARYGADNGNTFLVKFNDQWQEQQRWTYPPTVVEQLGTMSISGGLWYRGTLLVTDHDHRRLYKLRLPERGSVLELIETQPAPFTGQGIAVDPLTGGLVGIDRGKKQIIFAVEE